MTLEQQVQMLIDQAPADRQTLVAVQRIAPVLQKLAQRLQYLQYYLLQSTDQRWQTVTLQHQRQPQLEKTVLYAFAHESDARRSATAAGLLVEPVPIIQLLFQALTLQPVDSLIFLEVPGNSEQGIEIQRREIQQLVQAGLQPEISSQSNIPDNLA